MRKLQKPTFKEYYKIESQENESRTYLKGKCEGFKLAVIESTRHKEEQMTDEILRGNRYFKTNKY